MRLKNHLVYQRSFLLRLLLYLPPHSTATAIPSSAKESRSILSVFENRWTLRFRRNKTIFVSTGIRNILRRTRKPRTPAIENGCARVCGVEPDKTVHAHRETTQDDANAITFRCGSPRYCHANTCSPPCRDLDDIFAFCPNTMRLRYNCACGGRTKTTSVIFDRFGSGPWKKIQFFILLLDPPDIRYRTKRDPNDRRTYETIMPSNGLGLKKKKNESLRNEQRGLRFAFACPHSPRSPNTDLDENYLCIND